MNGLQKNKLISILLIIYLSLLMAVPAAPVEAKPGQTRTPRPTKGASLTPSPTVTPTRTPTATPSDVPLCADHSTTVWHALMGDGCHYDHEHGDPPDLANAYFGQPGALWGGQTIAYPFVSSPIENTVKHNGYKWHVRTPEYHPFPACGLNEENDILINYSNFCIVAVRAELHILSTMDVFSRYHSGFVEVYACKPPYRTQDCGTFKMGSSLIDWGQPRQPFYQTFRNRPFTEYTDPTYAVDFGDGIGNGMMMSGLLTDSVHFPDLPGISGEPYINLQPPSMLDFYRSHIPGDAPQTEQWSSNDYDCEPKPAGDTCHNKYFHLLVTIFDSWFLLDPSDMRNIEFICQAQPCYYNGSLTALNETGVLVPAEWDTDGDGFVTMSGFTDKFGNPVSGCTVASPNCVPFELVHMPVGVGQKFSNASRGEAFEHDVYIDRQPSGFIEFPN